MKFCWLDFEFNGVSERKLNLVSVSASTSVDREPKGKATKWLHGQEGSPTWLGLRKKFKELINEGYIFVAYAGEAEVRSLLTLFGDDRSWIKGFQLIDLYLEYRCLLNHCHTYAYGEQYIDGEVKTTRPPKPKWAKNFHRAGEEEELNNKPSYSLAAATFKLLGEKIDTDEKNEVRDVIISGDREKIEKAKDRILAYNESDIKYLHRIFAKVLGSFVARGISVEDWLRGALLRGDYSYRTALMVEAGYPVNMVKIKNFMGNINNILKSAAEDCLEIEPEIKSFRYDKKKDRYVACEKPIRAWVDKQNKPYWRRTDKGKKSLSKDAFGDWFNSQSMGFAGAYCRYLKTKQSLNGFLPGAGKGKKKKVFLDYVGKDNRVRPYFGIYGAQSSRSQPAATGFIPLKAHWMRNFIEADEGRAICGLDFASQEFLIAAIMSQDKRMIAAYASGDVYIAFAKDARLAPKTATKHSHKKIREVCKASVLGISYDMSSRGLAPRITAASGEECTEAEAQALIDKFYNTYSDYKAWKDSLIEEYEERAKLILSDGWVMWGNNSNLRSVGNFPVQGSGAVVMREAVRLAQNAGLMVIFTLHDAIYIEFDSYDIKAIQTLKDCMIQAFRNVMSTFGEVLDIRVEGEAWSKDYAKKMPTDKVEDVIYLTEYVDEKGKLDLERYREFFEEKVLTDINTDSIKDQSKKSAKYSNERETNGLQESGNAENILQVQRMQEGASLSL